MIVKDIVTIGFKEIWANKVRSFLSVLGVIIGVISLIVMMAIMAGMERHWLLYINEIGGMQQATVVSKIPIVDEVSKPELKRDLTRDDAEDIGRLDALVKYVSPEISIVQRVSYKGSQRRWSSVIGGTRDTFQVHRQSVSRGRAIVDEDIHQHRNVCVIGTEIRNEFFGPNTNPLGEMIDIGGLMFEVVGLLDHSELLKRGRNILAHKNKLIYIPLSVIPAKLDGGKPVERIRYVVHDRKDIGRASDEVKRIMERNHRVADDVEIKTAEDKFHESRKSMQAMKLGFSIIAGISLIVGGIGIMNIMIATVAQRVREIGIRKAVGARSMDVLIQFLMESVIVSGLGGIVGVLGSFVVVAVIAAFSTETPPVIIWDAILLACSSSILVGVFFGIYPATHAANLDPIEALRYQ